MKHTLTLCFSFLLLFPATAQVSAAYKQWVAVADSLVAANNYRSAAEAYTHAFRENNWKGYPGDRYNAACCWSRSKEKDSAFHQLFKIPDIEAVVSIEWFQADKDLVPLHRDKRWKTLVQHFRDAKDRREAHLDKGLLRQLDSLVTEDQKWRNYLTQYYNGELTKSRKLTFQKIVGQCALTDSLNYYYLRAMIEQYGFPDDSLVGRSGSHDFWLLVQHQDDHVEFQEQVLALMKPKVDRNLASGADYAYLLDRVRSNKGELQVYGTQMQLNADKSSFEPQPVEDPGNLNARRASVGLPTIEEYTKIMNTQYFGSLEKK